MATLLDNPTEEYLQSLKHQYSLLYFKSRVQLSSNGKSDGFVARCPIHSDRTPSFCVDYRNESWLFYCHGCKSSGDVLDFIRQVDNVTFPEAKAKFLEYCGTGVSRYTQPPAPIPAQPKVLKVTDDHVYQWRDRLQDALDPFDGKDEVHAYFSGRGISSDTLRAHNIGYCVKKFFKGSCQCEVCRNPQDAVVIPRYRAGILVGVKYRAVKVIDDHKWFQASGSDKGDFLYGLEHRADPDDQTVVIGEGEHEHLLLHSLGFNSAAIIGVNGVPKKLTPNFEADLKTLTETYSQALLIADNGTAEKTGNRPGIEAMQRLAGFLGKFPHRIANVPRGKDFGDFYQLDHDGALNWLGREISRLEKVAGEFADEQARLDNVFGPDEPVQKIDTPEGENPFDGLDSPLKPKPAHKETVVRPSSPIVARPLSEVTEQPIQWLWREFIPEKLTILAGAPGTGKSTLAYTLAAIVSSGGLWPDATRAAQGRVLIWSSEDTVSDIIVPRVKVADGDLTRVHCLEGVRQPDGTKRSFDPSIDIPELRKLVKDMPDVKLVIIDPIVSAVRGDMHKANDVRHALQAIVDFSGECGVSVLGISHFGKNTGGRDTTERVIGSQAFGAAPRMVLATAKNRETGECVLVRSKSNIAPDTGGFRYKIDLYDYMSDKNEPIRTVKLEWGETVEGSSREILSEVEGPSSSEPTKPDLAATFLTNLFTIKSGWLRSEIYRHASYEGIGRHSVEHAATAMGVIRSKGFGKPSVWSLPEAREAATNMTINMTNRVGESSIVSVPPR
jgi:putative DNA primase/helicase